MLGPSLALVTGCGALLGIEEATLDPTTSVDAALDAETRDRRSSDAIVDGPADSSTEAGACPAILEDDFERDDLLVGGPWLGRSDFGSTKATGTIIVPTDDPSSVFETNVPATTPDAGDSYQLKFEVNNPGEYIELTFRARTVVGGKNATIAQFIEPRVARRNAVYAELNTGGVRLDVSSDASATGDASAPMPAPDTWSTFRFILQRTKSTLDARILVNDAGSGELSVNIDEPTKFDSPIEVRLGGYSNPSEPAATLQFDDVRIRTSPCD